MEVLDVYTDGGSRGNPGPSAIGVVIGNKTYSQFIGKTTNNVAEYSAVIFALQKTKHLLGKKRLQNTQVKVHMDSQLVASQLQGKYRILKSELQPLFIEIWNLKFNFPHIEFEYIPREQNKKADHLVNEALDKKQLTLS